MRLLLAPVRRRSALTVSGCCLLLHWVGSVWSIWSTVLPDGPRLVLAHGLHQLVLALMAFAPALLAIWLWPRRLVMALLLVASGIALQLGTWADATFLAIYGYRLDGRTWRLLTTPGAGDILDLGAGTRRTLHREISLVIGVAALATLLILGALWRWREHWTRRLHRRLLPILSGLLAGGLIIALVIEAIGIRSGALPAATLCRRFGPLHPRLVPAPLPAAIPPVLAPERLGRVGLTLPALPPPGSARHRPHIILLALEGARAECDDPAILPRLSALGDAGLRATQHLSTGTTTRYAIFGLFYGLSGAWWEAAERSGTRSPLIQVLAGEGYRTHLYAATRQTNPPFHRVCFAGADRLVDSWDDDAIGGRVFRDRALTDRIVEDIRSSPDPLFVYALYDASHYPYLSPPEHEHFTPVVPLADLDLLTAQRRHDALAFAALKNRYRNALHYLDAEIGRIIDALAACGLLDESLIIVLGDHGEEFGEIGYDGGQVLHNGAFNEGQGHVLLLGHLPGGQQQRLTHPTSHADIPATIFSLLGLGDGTWGHGRSLLDPSPDRLLTMANYEEVVFIDDAAWIRVGRMPWNRDGLIATDPRGRPLPSVTQAALMTSEHLRPRLQILLRYAAIGGD